MDQDTTKHSRLSQLSRGPTSQRSNADPFLPDPHLEKKGSQKDEKAHKTENPTSATASNGIGLSWFGWGSKQPASEVAAPAANAVPPLHLNSLQGISQQKPESRRIAQSDRVYRERVLVRVYHLNKAGVTRAFNRNWKEYGLYHTGVELYGREWSYGMTFDEYSTGITWNPPMENPDHTYHETLTMGYTTLSPTQVWQLIEEMKVQWRGCEYHVLSRNCHTFTDAFCMRLGVNRAPTWINELAGVGEGIIEFLDADEEKGDPISNWFRQVKDALTDAFSPKPNAIQEKQSTPRSQPRRVSRRENRDQEPTRHNPFAALTTGSY